MNKTLKQINDLDFFTVEEAAKELGDQYVFVAMDAETKLVPAFKVGKRTYECTHSFIKDLQYRIITRFQLSTDSFKPYFNVVDEVFGEDIDYGQIHKEYREDGKGEKRYSPAQIIRVIINPLIGQPSIKHISTSYIERQNLTMRMQMRRFTRLTNAFSKKLRNLECAVALHFYHYNFMRIHSSLRVTPAMQANVTNHIWDWEELFGIAKTSKKAA
jgi:IS1 family transposase